MNTTRNQAMVCAKFLRAAVRDIRDSTPLAGFDIPTMKRNIALESIEGVAEALETVAATPQPEGEGVV